MIKDGYANVVKLKEIAPPARGRLRERSIGAICTRARALG
jgi:hypothetical protein